MAPWLRELTTLAEDLGWSPSSHMNWQGEIIGRLEGACMYMSGTHLHVHTCIWTP